MKTLTRHLLYLASFLALLLLVAGLTLFRETPVFEVVGGVLAIIATVAGVGWLSYHLNKPPIIPPTDDSFSGERRPTPTSVLVDQD
jgi:hypothetical protein